MPPQRLGANERERMTITYLASRHKWRALLSYQGERFSLGMWPTEEAAQQAVTHKLEQLAAEEAGGSEMAKVQAVQETADDGLGEFEGRPISAIKIIITRTGDGLSKAMTVAPKILHQGESGYIVLSYQTAKIRFDPAEDEDGEPVAERVQILVADGATFVDRDLVGDVVDTMRERIAEREARIKREKDEAKGIFTFDGLADDEE